jgi:hypothetical protein
MINKTPWISRNIAGARLMSDYGITYDTDFDLVEILRKWRNRDVTAGYEYVLNNHHIKTTVDDIVKNLKHSWLFNDSPDLDEGVEYESIWKPTAFCFGGTLAEIQWSLIDVSGISSKELKETELAEFPCSSDTPSLNIQIETRRDYRKRVRQARLKAALAELKARKMAEAYYRRYEGADESSDSELEESDLEDSAAAEPESE